MISVTRVGIGVGAGVEDELMEWWDTKKVRTGAFKTALDLSRLAGAVVGYGLEIFAPRMALGPAIAGAFTPLLTKSIFKAVKGAVSTPAAASFTPRRQASEVSRTYQPGFEQSRML